MERRLKKELERLSNDSSVLVLEVNDVSNAHVRQVILLGHQNGMRFRIEIPNDYPFRAPTVNLCDKNSKKVSGWTVCMRNWNPSDFLQGIITYVSTCKGIEGEHMCWPPDNQCDAYWHSK